MSKLEKKVLLKDGKRLDGRKPEDFRPAEMKTDVVGTANGSAMVKFGDTLAIAAVRGPRALFPRHLESESSRLKFRYNMAPFSVDDRKSPGPDRRSIELSKVMRLAFEPDVFLEDFPRATIDVYVEVLQADGSTRVTGINAASLALADAGIPMRDLVTACSVGKIDGTLIVDLNGDEDKNGEVDMAVAMLPTKKKITLLQMDGILSREELGKLLKMAVSTCEKIYEMEKKVLKDKYKRVE